MTPLSFDVDDPLRASRIVHWRKLQQADRLMRSGKVDQAVHLYEQALRKDFHRLYADPKTLSGWLIHESAEEPSLNWAAAFLFGYYIQNKVWWDWFAIVAPLIPIQDDLPLLSRSRIVAGLGWAAIDVIYSGTLKDEVKRQTHMLDLVKGYPLETALHSMVLGRLHQQLRNHDRAFTYLDQAASAIRIEDEPYFGIYVQETVASTYYFLNEFGDDYYQRAETIGKDVERLARSYNDGLDFTIQPYTLGWIYVEQGLLDDALREFKRGYRDTTGRWEDYDRGQYLYGIGYTYLCLEKLDQARVSLEDALFIFNHQSHLKTSMCLYLIALILKKQDNHEYAVEKALDALSNIKKVDNPVQRYHIYYHLFSLYRELRNWWQALRYGILTYYMKVILKRPLNA